MATHSPQTAQKHQYATNAEAQISNLTLGVGSLLVIMFVRSVRDEIVNTTSRSVLGMIAGACVTLPA